MKRSASLRGFVLALVLLGTAETPLEAQTPTLQDVQVEDLRGLKDKFISLGEAFSAEIYDRDVELPRLEALPKPQLLAELGRTFDHIIAVIEGMDEAERARTTNFFGQALPVSGAIHYGMGDMHEHLGQLIAYARTNHVVPPWSN